jgi:predicted small metal-binding protein
MRVIECNICGEVLQAGDDEELVQVAVAHMSGEHPDSAVGEEQVRGMVKREAYSATDA